MSCQASLPTAASGYKVGTILPNTSTPGTPGDADLGKLEHPRRAWFWRQSHRARIVRELFQLLGGGQLFNT
jgi:hypothetical protein